MQQAAVDVDALAIPAQQTAHGERMAQVMQAWLGHAGCRTQVDFGVQLAARPTEGLGPQAVARCQREQRRFRIARRPVDRRHVSVEALRQVGAQGQQAALVVTLRATLLQEC